MKRVLLVLCCLAATAWAQEPPAVYVKGLHVAADLKKSLSRTD
jgi:hypothetical protein